MIRVLGIDPGTKNVGYAVLHFDTQIRYIKSGVINPDMSQPMCKVLEYIRLCVKNLVIHNEITHSAIERYMLGGNSGFNMTGVNQAIGAILTSLNDAKPREYSAKQMKKYVTGNGNAEKEDIMKAIQSKLGVKITVNHAADACGLALMRFSDCKDYVVDPINGLPLFRGV